MDRRLTQQDSVRVHPEQAEALGWTAKHLFGLHKPPNRPHPSYSRLSRYDETGLIWLLGGREVVALTEATAAIQSSTGAITTYRRHNKPALGPVGDSASTTSSRPSVWRERRMTAHKQTSEQ
jgi:hypothetical protein